MIDLDRPVKDRLLLLTVPGAADVLAEELRTTPGVRVAARRPDAVDVEVDGPLRPLAENPFYLSAALRLGSEPLADVERSRREGVLATLDDPIRFRVGQVGERRWELRDALTEQGWVNAPSDWLLNLEPEDEGLRAELGPLHWPRRHGELPRAPASTNPVIAAVMVRMAKIDRSHTVVDPMCGAGTLLAVAAQLRSPARLLGADHDRRWVRAARSGLDSRGAVALLWRGDVRATPLPEGSADRLLANLPFGKRVGSHRGNAKLYPALLRETARLLRPGGRAVLLTEDKRLFQESVQRTRGLRIVKRADFATGGAHPTAYVLSPPRRP